MPAGFEPARAEPNGLAVHLLNRSDKASKKRVSRPGIEPGFSQPQCDVLTTILTKLKKFTPSRDRTYDLKLIRPAL